MTDNSNTYMYIIGGSLTEHNDVILNYILAYRCKQNLCWQITVDNCVH